MKTALVTGSSGGIGKAIYVRLEEYGYEVFGISRYDVGIICDLQDTKTL